MSGNGQPTNKGTEQKHRLALPSSGDSKNEHVQLGDTHKLEDLGPVIVNEDGTISRINNWKEMAEIEKVNVRRILLKRNEERLARLRAQQQEQP